MHYSTLIQGYHRGPSLICNIHELISQRKSDVALVSGSGPSLNSVLQSEIFATADLIGTASVVLAEKKPAWIFWESSPLFDLEPEPGYGTLDFTCTDLIFYDRLRDCLLEREIESVLINPFFPSKHISSMYGYLCPLPKAITQMYLDYFFVNESNFARIEQDLRMFSNLKSNSLLNFRCSLVRMISFAFALEYPNIVISGIDPSSSSYWYTEQSANYYAPMSEFVHESLMNKKLMIKNELSGRNCHEGESYGETINMSDSVWYAIPYLIKWAKTNNKIVPNIEYCGNDLKTINAIKAFCSKFVSIKPID